MSQITPGDPLRATIADRLREQAEDEERAAAAQAASERQEQRKAGERASTLRHTGGALRLRPRRGIAGPRTAAASIPPWVVPAVVVAGLWFARRSRLALFAGAAIGTALLASRWVGEVDAY